MKKILFILFMLVVCKESHSPLMAQVHPEYFLRQGMEVYQEKKFSEAIQYFSTALSLDSSNTSVYYILSAAFLANQEAGKSLRIAKKGMEKFPLESSFYWLAAEAELQLQNFPAALNFYKEVKKHYIKEGKLPQQVNERMLKERIGQLNSQLGSLAAKENNYQKALSYFQEAYRYLPEHPSSYTNLAFTYLQLQRWEQALAVAEKGLLKFPDQQSLIGIKTNALYQKKDYKGLIDEYRKLYQQNPEELEVAITYAELLMADQQYQEAQDFYTRLLEAHPTEKQIYESLIRVYESNLNYPAKVTVLKKMLPHFQEKAPIYQQLSETLSMMEKWKDARAYYDTLLQWSDDPIAIKEKIAQTYLEQDSLQQAEEIYLALLSSNSEIPELFLQLGKIQEELLRWQEALETYKRWNDLTGSEKSFIRLGFVHEKLGNRDSALKNYETTIRNGTTNPLPFLGVSRLLRQSNLDSSFQLSKNALSLSFEQLKQEEKKVTTLFSGSKSLTELSRQKQVIAEAKKQEEAATEAFDHFTSFDYEKVKPALLTLTEDFRESAKLHFLIGRFYYRNQEYESALQRLNSSVGLYSNMAEAHLLIGKIQRKKENLLQSILAYERVLTLDAKNKEAYQQLIKLYQQEDKLELLSDKWLARYRGDQKNQVLKEYLMEALHKAGKFELAKEIGKEN